MLSLVELFGCALAVPDHSTVSRRAAKLTSIARDSLPSGPLHLLIDSMGLKVFGAGEWLVEKHGRRSRRTWRKLHLGSGRPERPDRFKADPSVGDTHLLMIASLGRMGWQEVTGYGRRALVETAMGRYKGIIVDPSTPAQASISAARCNNATVWFTLFDS